MDAKALTQESEQQQLRIEERRRSLRIEKALSEHHKALAGILSDLRRDPIYDAEDPLQAALWCLGAAMMQIVRVQGP